MDTLVVLAQDSKNLEIWIPAVVSIVTLLITLAFYIFVQPRISYKSTIRESLTATSVELLNYLAEIVSYQDFDGVPTKIRQYSLQIHLYFKQGIADKEINDSLEDIYDMVKKRKELTKPEDIEKWNEDIRNKARELRKGLAKYCGRL